MRFKSTSSFLMSAWNNGIKTPFVFLGPPGIGKTSLGHYVADLMTAQLKAANPAAQPAICISLDLSSRLPEDLLGLPWRNQEDDCTDYCPQRWLAELCEDGAVGVLILDDLPAASPAIQVASRQLVLERRIHDHYLSDGILIIVTGNRRQDKAKASTLPSHFCNSVCFLELTPDLDSWAEWYAAQGNMSSDVTSFLRFRPTHLSKLPQDADRRGAFATPRTWSKLGEMWDVAHEMGFGLQVAQGLVGEGVATEFVAFVNVKSKLVDPMEVLRNPKIAIKDPSSYLNSPDKVYAMVTAIAEHGFSHKMGMEFLVALGWCSNGNKEYIGAAINHWKAFGDRTAMPLLVKAIRKAHGNPQLKAELGPVMEWLDKVHGA